MAKYVPLNTWIKKHKIKKSDVISFVDGLENDVRELSNILGFDVILAVKESPIRNKKRNKNTKNSKLKIEYKPD
jgi:hypothetical protein